MNQIENIADECGIRPTRVEDADAIAAIHAELFPGPWSAPALIKMTMAPVAVSFVAVREGAIVGYVIANSVAGETEILSIGVAKAAQRHGIAASLLRALIKTARMRLAGRVFLEVAESNAPARALYRRFGFTLVGRRAAYYSRGDGPREDALVLAIYPTTEGC